VTAFNHFIHKTDYPAWFEILERLQNKILSIFISDSEDYFTVKSKSIFELLIEDLLNYKHVSKSLPENEKATDTQDTVAFSLKNIK
jgi:hypothetical protein